MALLFAYILLISIFIFELFIAFFVARIIITIFKKIFAFFKSKICPELNARKLEKSIQKYADNLAIYKK